MVVRTKTQYKEFLKVLTDYKGELAVDTETSRFLDKDNIKPWTLELEGIGIYAKEIGGFYITVDLVDDKLRELFKDRVCIMHNAQFDLQVLETYGIFCGEVHDSMIAAHICNENRPNFKLKDLARTVLKYKDVTYFNDLGDKPTEKKALDEWIEAMGEYCIQDCKFTFELFNLFREKMQKDGGLWEVYTVAEQPLIKVLASMTRRGIKVDVKYLEEMKVKLETRIKQLEVDSLAALNKAYGIDKSDFNTGSTKQLSEYLYEFKKYKIPEDFRTPSGKLSTNVEALKFISLKYKDPIAENVLKYRELSKLLSTYVEGILKRQEDSILHPTFRQLGAKTGRMSSANPNAQNIGRRADEFDIRKAFIPEDGYVFIDGDFSQIEPRLTAHFSKCEALVKLYKEGGDLHQMVADSIGSDRQTGKTLGLAVLYGMSGWSLGKRLGIPEAKAQTLINNYFKSFPEILKLIEDAKREVKTTYAIRSLLGRKRRYPEIAQAFSMGDERKIRQIEREAVNCKIQASAATVMKLAMIKAEKAIKPFGARLLLTVHDELLIQAPIGTEVECSKALKEAMENAFNFDTVAMVVEPKIMTKWGK